MHSHWLGVWSQNALLIKCSLKSPEQPILSYLILSAMVPCPETPHDILNAKRMKGRILVNLIESTWYILVPFSAHDTAYTYAIIRCTYHSPAWKLLPGKQSCRITDAYRMLQSIKYLHFWCLGGGEPCRCDSRGIKEFGDILWNLAIASRFPVRLK